MECCARYREALHLVEEENKVYSITPSTYNANQCQNTAKVRRKLNLNESVDSMPPKALVSKQDSTSISTTIAVQNSSNELIKYVLLRFLGLVVIISPLHMMYISLILMVYDKSNSLHHYATLESRGKASQIPTLLPVQMALFRVPESPADISIIDDFPTLHSVIKDLREDVNKVKEEIVKYIEPSLSPTPWKARVLKPVAENAHARRVLRTGSGSSGDSWRSTLKEIPLGRRRRSDMRVINNHVATRMDNSLLVTTKKFIELRKEDNTVNLNEAAVVLNVPKRRLYDITNVLEGVDLVEKVGKNSIRWKTDDGDSSELSALKSQCKSLSAQESELDALLIDLTSAVNLMKEDPTDKPYGYIHLKDIRSVNAFHDQTLIVLKSHPEAQCVIEVTDPTKTHKFQMKMKSEDCSPLGAYICHSDANTVSSIEDFLSSAESSSNVVSARHKSEPTSSTHINDQMVFETNNKVDSSTMDGNTDIVLPKADLRHDSLSDLITPDKVMFQGSGAFPSPLKMLLDPYAQFPNSGEADSSNTLLTPDTADPDPYNFPSSGLSLNDLFSASDWELPQ
ncbi:transcription factor E2F/dimerization partner [Dictyocaulus viviparus]|uniref:Transcription factor E2F/dimerization partner n=1 Tax=Dictyocaulus viviparus TaxID=29172 RepID=A0A0D8XWH4_DICVI|nr:transcription factor E2F/dimerization partner [Dictyocaulus viviparus]